MILLYDKNKQRFVFICVMDRLKILFQNWIYLMNKDFYQICVILFYSIIVINLNNFKQVGIVNRKKKIV